ncbi:MAG: sugar phosphorylase, partial [Planctomycetia bacterium]|nr:sugar phosphorylase [Planctomycetia bacterium]
MSLDAVLRDRLAPRLRRLYGDRAEQCLDKILDRARKAAAHMPPPRDTPWDQRDVVLITYADQVRAADRCPLAALGQFLGETGLDRVINTVHLLPCFPYSSDDGFSVIDYRRIDPALGDWADVRALGRKHSLMLDLVLNHVSRRSPWYAAYAAGREPYVRYFLEVDPAADLSAVTRPRSLPLLTPVETARGTRYLWTTFSDDQIDLNYAEPDVLVEMIDVLLFYLEQGARIIRLDGIAYLWKQPGTPCIHLPQTHEVVKLLRDVVDAVAPGTILLTETNVPQAENTSYFGDGGDEARMVYQFSLAPLLLEALLSGDAGLLVGWLAELEPTPPGTTTLNFTASHDGIGVRPLEGLMPPDRFERLIESVIRRGGRVSTKRNPDGSESPYELNVTYFSALAEPDRADGLAVQVRRFLASQALMLSLRGVPAVYFHSLVATPNDVVGAERTGRARSINRRKFDAAELRAALGCLGSPPA